MAGGKRNKGWLSHQKRCRLGGTLQAAAVVAAQSFPSVKIQGNSVLRRGYVLTFALGHPDKCLEEFVLKLGETDGDTELKAADQQAKLASSAKTT